jgi:hypothetical protein
MSSQRANALAPVRMYASLPFPHPSAISGQACRGSVPRSPSESVARLPPGNRFLVPPDASTCRSLSDPDGRR